MRDEGIRELCVLEVLLRGLRAHVTALVTTAIKSQGSLSSRLLPGCSSRLFLSHRSYLCCCLYIDR